jgi:hypothetical protein
MTKNQPLSDADERSEEGPADATAGRLDQARLEGRHRGVEVRLADRPQGPATQRARGGERDRVRDQPAEAQLARHHGAGGRFSVGAGGRGRRIERGDPVVPAHGSTPDAGGKD